ncbi:hypothetical protein P5673_003624 [Acropora cervicornis]|uniref:DALR anticodon binding domain-containing protein n=1 Tax=Acropora cervicornis TaxID=6130 RepID=A0AAD9R1L9_ACRCE|nr:hypothetical protein P5673_003624 [Acropora cervicornis]
MALSVVKLEVLSISPNSEDEWELLISFIATFPTIVKDTVPTLAATSQSFVIHTNKESRTHLFPTMFARLYLMKALQQIFQNCLELLNVSYLTQM